MYHDYSAFERTGIPLLLFVLACITFLMRCWIKKRAVNGFSLDDWFMLLSVVFYAVETVIALELVHVGFGDHIYELKLWQIEQILKLFSIGGVFYVLTSISVKFSIAFLLLRLTMAHRAQRMTIIGNTVIYTLSALAFGFFVFFQCHPVEYYWDKSIENGHCVSEHAIEIATYVYASICLITDLVFALLPAWMIHGIQMDIRTKISVCVILGLGVLSSATNIARMKFLDNVDHSEDFFYMLFPISMCTAFEIGIGIIAANMATFRPLLRQFVHWTGSTFSRRSSFISTGKSNLSDFARRSSNFTMRSSKGLMDGNTAVDTVEPCPADVSSEGAVLNC